MASMNSSGTSSTTEAPSVERIIHDPAIKETIIPTTTTIIQPVIHREIETTEIHKIIQPIYESAAPLQYQDVVTSQGVRQEVPIPSNDQFGSFYQQPTTLNPTQQQTNNVSGNSNNPGIFRKRRIQSHPIFNKSQSDNIKPMYVDDVSHHSFRWAHRDRHLTSETAYNGRSSKNKTTTPMVTQTTTTTTSIEEVPANNIPVSSKKPNIFQSLFGRFRKNRNSVGGNVSSM